MNRFTMSNLALLMSYKVSAREVEKILDRLNVRPSDNMAMASDEAANLAVVQLLRKRYSSLSEYVSDMNLYVSDAVNRRAHLVCFPAYAGVLPLSFLPQFDAALRKIQPREDTGLPDMEQLNHSLSYFSDFMFDAYYHTMSQLAARHRVYIMAGSVLYFDDSDLRHRAFLFNDDGDMVGYQDKISLDLLEQSLQVDPGSEIKRFDTPVGPLSILIGSDVNYYETARAAKGLGAKMLLNPAVFTREYTPVDVALGLNLRVQETGLYGVQSVMVGDTDLGFTLEGPSCVFVPMALSKKQSRNHILAKTNSRFQPDLVMARLNMSSLNKVSHPYLHDSNPDLMPRYIDRLY